MFLQPLAEAFETLESTRETDPVGVTHESSMQNGTTEENSGKQVPPALLIAYDVLIIVQVSVMMFAMGSGVDTVDLKRQLRHPKAIILGMICQLLVMPFLCFAIAHMLNFDDSTSIGLVVVAGCPGGAPSNLFTTISRGDLSLSVCLTVISSALVLGTMPLNKVIYLGSWTDEPFVIPYLNIVIGIVATWIPAILGMLVRYNYPKKAPKVTKIGGISAFILLLLFAAVQNLVYPGLFALPLDMWFAALIIPVLGWLVGYGFSAMFLLEIAKRRAIAYGTSYVNAGLMLALISITYGSRSEETTELIQYPMLYMVTQLAMGVLLTLLHALYFAIKEERTFCQKFYYKRITRLRPLDTYEEVLIGVGAPPLESQVRRYEEIIFHLFGKDTSQRSENSQFEYSTNGFSSKFIEVDLNPDKPLRQRARTIAQENVIKHQLSSESTDSAATDVTFVDNSRRRSSLPCVLEAPQKHVLKLDDSDHSSGFSGSTNNMDETDREIIERF